MITFGETLFAIFSFICLCLYIYEHNRRPRSMKKLNEESDENYAAPETNEHNNYLTDSDKAYRLWKSLFDRTAQDKINWKYNLDADRANNYNINKRDYSAKVNGVEVQVTEYGNLYFDGNLIASDTEIKYFMQLHYEISSSIDRREMASAEKDKTKSINKFLGKKTKL